MKDKNGDTINTRKFVGWWLGMSFGMWILSPAIVFALLLLLGFMLLAIGGESPSVAVDVIVFLLFASTFATIVGYLVGFLQQRVFRQVLNISFPRWRKWSAIGGFLALFPTFIGAMISPILIMPMFIGMISLLQWWQLKKYAQSAWLWMLSNVIGGLTFMVLFVNILYAVNIWETFGRWSAAVLLQGLITAFMMVWLLQGMDLEELREEEAQLGKAKKRLSQEEERDDSFLDEYLGDAPIWDEA